jgi:hypothetical protein
VESHAIVGAYAVVSFWSFLAICAVAGMILDYRKKQLAVQSLKLAAEHGQNIDPAVIKALLSQQKQDNELNPAALLVGGVITVSVGVGVVLLAFFLSGVAPKALYPVMGGGVVTLCTGIGILIAGRLVARSQAANALQGTTG